MQVSMNTNISTYSTQNTNSTKNVSKPTWNGNKVYTYLEDYNDAAISYGKQAAMYYSGITNQDGAVTLELSKEALTAQADEKNTTESYGGSVGFNEGKRARQLAAAKTIENVQTVMSILQTDLKDCQSGLENGMCDENEVNKVKAMIEKAKQRLAEVSGNENSSYADENAFSMSMLM